MHEFARCRRAFYYKEIKRLERIDLPSALHIGKTCGEALAKIHTAEKFTLNLIDNFFEELTEEHLDTKPHENSTLKDLCMLWATLRNYPCREKGQPEYEWEGEIDGVKVAGKVDLYVKKTPYEFKYTSQPNNYDSYTLADQIGFYMLGTGATRAVARIVKKPQFRPTQLETTRDFLSRCTESLGVEKNWVYQDIKFYKADFHDYQKKLIKKVKLIRKEIDRLGDSIDLYYRTAPEYCKQPFICIYLPICESNDIISKYLYTKRKED